MSVIQAFEEKLKNTSLRYSIADDEKPIVPGAQINCIGENKNRMISIMNRLTKSELGREALQTAAEKGFSFEFSNAYSACGFTDPGKKRVVLHSDFSDDKLVGTLCHECRHAGQFSRAPKEMLYRTDWDIQTTLRHTRAMEADAQAYAVAACEQLARQGDTGPKKEFSKNYPEITKGFEESLKKNGNEVNNNVLTDAFKAWYDQPKLKEVYEKQYLVKRMTDDAGYMMFGLKPSMTFSVSIPAEQTISSITVSKNGNYFQDDPAILNGGKYMDVSESTMRKISGYFNVRKYALYGDGRTASLDGISVRSDVPETSQEDGGASLSASVQADKIQKIMKNKEAVRQQGNAIKTAQFRKLSAKRGR